MLKCLKLYSDWDPSGAEHLNEEIYKRLCDAAGVDRETFNSAVAIVSFDGWYGPCTDEDYENEGHKITKSEALRIIKAARKVKFSDIGFQNPEYPPCCSCEDCCDCHNSVIEGETIYNELWFWYRKIYG